MPQSPALFFLTMLAATQASFGADVTLPELRAAAAHTTGLVHSYRLAGNVSYSSGLETQAVIYRSLEKYRCERRDVRGWKLGRREIPPMHAISAYDGQYYQMLFLDDGVLKELESDPGQLVPDPFLMSYRWLTAGVGEVLSFDNNRSKDVWAKRFESAIDRGEEQLRSHECRVIEFDQIGVDGGSYRVFFAKEFGYFPLRHERWLAGNEQAVSGTDVVEYVLRSVDGHAVLIPTKTIFEETGQDGRSLANKYTFAVDLAALEINTRFDDDLFRLSSEQADAVAEERGPEERGPSAGNGSWAGLRGVVLAVIAVLVALLLLVFSGRYMRRQRA